MARGKRVRVARCIYRDAYGYSICVRRQEYRRPLGTPESALLAFRDDLEHRPAETRPRQARGTLADDVDRYIGRVKHLASWRERRSDLRAWVALYGPWPRSRLRREHVIAARLRWLEEGRTPKCVNNRVDALMTKAVQAAKRGRGVSPIYLDEDDQPEQSNVIYMRGRRRRRIVFGWYGGKFSHLDWLLPLLPKCHHYCEPFAGSGAVLINREPAPVETYNDIDGDVVNFFRVLRDRHEELIRAIALTPFSREEYHRAIYGSTNGISDVERARRFYIKARQTRTGLAQTASLGRWANCKDTSRAGMSGVVSRWLGGVDALDEIAQRLIRVQIENRPAVDVIRLYDSPKTLFYCDPPYLHATRGDAKAYGFEMDEGQHREFAEVVNECKGMVAVSGYDHPLMDELFKPGRWFKTQGPDKTIHSTKGKRSEVLWTNYDPKNQKGLFE